MTEDNQTLDLENQKLRIEKSDLQNEVEKLAQKRAMLNEEIAKAQEKKRQAAVEQEAVADAQQNEKDSERMIMLEQRKQLAIAETELKKGQEAMQLRLHALEKREVAVKAAESENAMAAHSIENLRREADERMQEVRIKEEEVSAMGRYADEKIKELATLEKKNRENVESSIRANAEAKIFVERARKAEENARIDKLEIESKLQKIQETDRQIKLFTEMATELKQFILEHSGDKVRIEAYINEQYPLATDKLHVT